MNDKKTTYFRGESPTGKRIIAELDTVNAELFGFAKYGDGEIEPEWTGDTNLDTQEPLQRDGENVYVDEDGDTWKFSEIKFVEVDELCDDESE